MSDMHATIPILTELAEKILLRDKEQPRLEDTTVKVLAASPIRGVPTLKNRDTGFLAVYENEAGSFLMLGCARRLDDDKDRASITARGNIDVVEGWYVTILSTGRPLYADDMSTPAVVWGTSCLLYDDNEMIYGAVDMTGTADKLTVELNGEAHAQQFENGAAVLCCTFVPSENGQLVEARAVIDSGGVVLSGGRDEVALI
jgi:hypothetical protein